MKLHFTFKLTPARRVGARRTLIAILIAIQVGLFGTCSLRADLDTGLQAYYSFDGNANDQSGNGNNGIVHNAVLTTDRFGNANSAFSFNGIDSYISAADSPTLQLSINFTLSAWFFQPTAGTSPTYSVRLIDKSTAGVADGYLLSAGALYDRRTSFIGGQHELIATSNSALDNWHHIAVTFSGSIGTLYVDDTVVATGTAGAVPTNSLSLLIGAPHVGGGVGSGPTNYFNGKIDDVRIYNRALSQQEVFALSNQLNTLQTSRLPSAPLTTIHQVTNNQLEVFSNGQFIQGGGVDTSKPTIVLAHGWNSSPAMFSDLAASIKTQHPAFNVIAWDWSSEAATGNSGLGLAASRVPDEGAGFGLALTAALGVNYSQPIQFIGHSLGTLLDAQAAQVFRTHVNASSAANTQVTLFDDAEIANLFTPGTTPYLNSIPKLGVADRMDNYISAVGGLHSEARNIVLTKPGGMGEVAFHSYPVTWYTPTVAGTRLDGGSAPADAGFGLSITTGTSGDISNSYYGGLTDGSITTAISEADAKNLLSQRLVKPQKYAEITGTAQVNGHANVTVEERTDPSTQLSVSSVSVQLVKHSPSYVWLSLSIPSDAQTLLFDFKFDNLSIGDWLSVGINDTLLFALESQYLDNGLEATSTPLDVSGWDGQNVELFLGLNNVDDANAGGDITVHNLRFETAPEPSMAALLGLVGCFFANRRRRIRG